MSNAGPSVSIINALPAAATTKTTPGGVDGWITVNVNGTLFYIPLYLSQTA